MSDLFTALAGEAMDAPMMACPRTLSQFEAPPPPLNLATDSEWNVPVAPDSVQRPHTFAPISREETHNDDALIARTEISQAFFSERVQSIEVQRETVKLVEQHVEPAIPLAMPQPAASEAKAEPARPVQPTMLIREEVVWRDPAVSDTASGTQAEPLRQSPAASQPIAPHVVVPGPSAVEMMPRARAKTHLMPPVQERKSADAAPTVHVTIGRVEVRAVSPPGPTRSAPPPKPAATALSLAEYLEQRNRSS